ncbi:hypothetical protein NC651_027600 [Populus alba x Populus x berolinensis]|nr:hypothetical protein NC651_027600 [Populus alba x Populus x berolinensis]
MQYLVLETSRTGPVSSPWLTLPPSLFPPLSLSNSDNSLSPTTTTSDPFIFPYHIVPQRLAFADLQQFKAFSRLPTLILDKSTHHQQFCTKFHSPWL